MADAPTSSALRDAAWNVLIIDDDEDDFLIARQMLREARGGRFELTRASSYAEGREALFSGAYHAVLVDYDLGKHSGIALIREATARGVAAPLILFTGRGSYEVDLEAMQAGATMYLTKSEVNPLLFERAIRYAIELKQKEHALARSDERFSRAFHSSPAALAITRVSDGRYVEANESLCQLTGYTREEILGRTAFELGIYARPEQRAEILRLLQKHGRVSGYEIDVRHASGELRAALGSIDVIEVDRQPCMLATLIDITWRRQAERASGESENRLREFIENTHDNYFSLDREWRITYANRHYLKIMGAQAEELIGKNFWEVFPEYAGTDVEAIYRKVMDERVPAHFQRAGIYTASQYDISLYPTRDGLASFSIDRTEEVRQRQMLEGERARLNTVLQSIPVGVWIADQEGRLLSKNEDADQIWAGSAPLLESVDEYPQYTAWDPQTGRQLEGQDYPVAVALRTRQPVRQKELRIRRMDGSGGYVLVSATPILNPQGEVTGVVGINMDITSRKQAEQELARKEAELSESQRIAHVGSWYWDLQTDTTVASDELYRIYGLEPGVDPLPHFADQKGVFYPADSWDALHAAVQRALQTGEGYEMDLRGLRGGDPVWVTTRAVVVRDEAGQVLGLRGTIQDITARKVAEAALRETADQLQRSNQDLEQFAFVASHDLQEPLRKIVMFGKSLRPRLPAQDDSARDSLSRMQAAAGRMQAMIDGLLDLSRVNARGKPLKTVDTVRLVREVAADLELRIETAGGRVEIGDLPPIRADAIQMRQVFQNLIGNAIKFRRPGVAPVVRISAAVDGGSPAPMVEIRVEDNGIGIRPEYSEEIFQPFRRLHGQSEYEGTGLGLAICRKIAERHGGAIRVESAPGEGAAFILRLPRG